MSIRIKENTVMKKNIGIQLALYPTEYLRTGEVIGKCRPFKDNKTF